MFITSREKSIIELIIKTAGKHTALTLASYLNVSARTVHRDLASVVKVLRQFGLELGRTPDEGLVISGRNEDVFRLVQTMAETIPTDQTPQERKLLILLELLKGEPFKLQPAAKEVGISVTTYTAYLDELAGWLESYRLSVRRKRGVGVELSGKESDIRKALADYYLIYFNEELIESLFLLDAGSWNKPRVLYYFRSKFLYAADRLAGRRINKGQSRLADSDYIGILVHLCISLQRTEGDFCIEDDLIEPPDIKEEANLIASLGNELADEFSVCLAEQDIRFLAIVLKGSKLQAPDSVHYDSVMIGQSVKNIIQHVSAQLNADLTGDFSLFQGLLAHMETSIFRIRQNMGMHNPLTEDIKKKYPALFLAVKNSLEQEFRDISFPDDEAAFIALHFGSVLLLREEQLSVHALIICPTGIGTSKMLASRIKKELPEIRSVEISSIKEIQQTDLNSYDIIFSTVRLPYTDLEYILVNPLLEEEDILAAKGFLQKHIGELAASRTFSPESSYPKQKERSIGLGQMLSDLGDVQNSIKEILRNFRFYFFPEAADHEEVVSQMVHSAKEQGSLSESSKVITRLREREKLGGLGIPKTGLALFHCRHEAVKELIFQVSRLGRAVQLKGMDGRMMEADNLLLMLAPESLSPRQQEIVSLISTSLIENDEAMLIFSSGSEEAIKKRLEEIFLDYIQNQLIKG
ncbi:BglG family transcription antiterminator [Bacillus infantis]|uniref:BglG family transcription antiterminator n=1 Tax=Bacillus infantis TaxID=324767 RepID=UPI0039824387